MQNPTASFILSLFMSSAALPAPAPGNVTGQLIDIGNYAAGHSLWEYTGVHARACALEGFDVGLLTSDGKVYYVKGELAANSNTKLLPYMLAPSVTITGDVEEKDGLLIITGRMIKQ